MLYARRHVHCTPVHKGPTTTYADHVLTRHLHQIHILTYSCQQRCCRPPSEHRVEIVALPELSGIQLTGLLFIAQAVPQAVCDRPALWKHIGVGVSSSRRNCSSALE